ncbi:hypothetical protein NHQ30_007552 [Ciborinia camelliae]|nr:hypothetical protein NHQ30_007552 [Ciborinia camelliae]
MVSIPQFILRICQFICIIIATSLIGNVIASQRHSHSSVNYAMFAAAFAWIALLYGFAAAFVESLAERIILMPLDGLACFFTWVAGVVLAAKLHVHSCGNLNYVIHNPLTQGSKSQCRELQAACAFFWFAFALFAGSLVVEAISGRSSTSMRRPGSRKNAPTMSQV